jgi:hypothetical protein
MARSAVLISAIEMRDDQPRQQRLRWWTWPGS